MLHQAWIVELDALYLKPCKPYERLLADLSETEKVAGAAATTLMTLLPALLVFGPFPTAEISAMIACSTWPAFVTAGFTLGLSTSKMITLGKNRIIRVIDLCTRDIIENYGWNPINDSY